MGWRRGLPLFRAVRTRPIEVGYRAEDGLSSPDELLTYETEEIHPIHVSGAYAVYEMAPGEFHVHKNGWMEIRPFKTTDLVLARGVCDRWEEVYQAEASRAQQERIASRRTH